MKIIKKKLLALGLACAALFAGHDAMATDLEITAQATIAQPITLTKDTGNNYGSTGGNLSFGVITPGSELGWVDVVAKDGQGGIEFDSSTYGSVDAKGTIGGAIFTVKGAPSSWFTVTVPTEPIELRNLTDPTKTLFVGIHEVGDGFCTPPDVSGVAVIGIGGILTVPPDAATGTYSGTFTVGVEYD